MTDAREISGFTPGPDYKTFAEWAIREGSWYGLDLDAGAIQDKAIECGIIEVVPYDPDVHGDNDFDVAPGEEWCVFVIPSTETKGEPT